MNRSLDEFIYSGLHGLQVRPYGQNLKTWCPVCSSADVQVLWKIPMTRIDPPVQVLGGYFNQIPTLRAPFEIFGFDLCRNCNSIYLNPVVDRENMIESYRASTSYLKKMANSAEWQGYEERYNNILGYLPQDAHTLVDAACGMGQILFLAQKDPNRRWKRLIGLELSQPYVANMKENGVEAYQFDLDRDDNRAILEPGCADFVSFLEAFEHVERPLGVLAKLLDLLRVGGRIYFTAQRYGDDADLPVRPGEEIYIGPRLLDLLPELLPCRIVEAIKSGTRYLVALERTRGGITEVQLGLGLPGQPVKLDPEIPLIGPYEREIGHCFKAYLARGPRVKEMALLGDSDASPRQSPVLLLEDRKPIGRPHSAHSDIRERGEGRYSHWRDTVYFSTPDNSDPNQNGRSYTLKIEGHSALEKNAR